MATSGAAGRWTVVRLYITTLTSRPTDESFSPGYPRGPVRFLLSTLMTDSSSHPQTSARHSFCRPCLTVKWESVSQCMSYTTTRVQQMITLKHIPPQETNHHAYGGCTWVHQHSEHLAAPHVVATPNHDGGSVERLTLIQQELEASSTAGRAPNILLDTLRLCDLACSAVNT